MVLGYGASARKQDLSASVGVVSNTEELAARPVTSTESMLQGQLPGVTIQADGGDPTSSPSIVIRGQGSQDGDNVLWVVDGVPGAPIASMNDIESIVVLRMLLRLPFMVHNRVQVVSCWLPLKRLKKVHRH